MKKQILGLAGSIRSNFHNFSELENYIKESETFEELLDKVSKSSYKYANSDICLAFSLLGAKKDNSDFKIMSIAEIFKVNEKNINSWENKSDHMDRIKAVDFLTLDNHRVENLYDEISKSLGIILATPVYFGDRSSVANKFMQLTNNLNLLNNKVFGMVSVGAKRNGGQETACIYGLYDALMQKSVIVGNGPITSQYGGTVVSGDMHSAPNDNFGLTTCYSLGKRVSNVSDILYNGQSYKHKKKLNVLVINTMDTPDKYFRSVIEEYFDEYRKEHEITIVDLIDLEIERCYACKLCPSIAAIDNPNQNSYLCINQTARDSMRLVHDKLDSKDCIVIVGANTCKKIFYRYQVFIERTRYIRRSDFQLTNTPIIGLLINEAGAINHPLHNLKVLTSYIRHNTIILKPIELFYAANKKFYENSFREYIPILQQISHGRKKTMPMKISYKASGYKDVRLDSTFEYRQ